MSTGDRVVVAVCLFFCFVIIGALVWMAINDFVLQPRADARGRVKQWCSGCDRHDRHTWDMAWTEDNGRWWCSDCRKGK